MRLYVMRHGDALSGLGGPRRLSEKGIGQAEAAGLFLRRIGEIPDVIVHSTLTRSKETAEHVAKMAGAGDCLKMYERIEPDDSPEDFLATVIPEFSPSRRNILVVGHDPFVSRLGSLLLAQTRAAVSFHFKKGTLLCVESAGTGIRWTPRLYIDSDQLVLLRG